MKTILKWLTRLLAVFLIVVLGAWTYIYVASERATKHVYESALLHFAASTDASAIATGHRQAVIHGCTSCHGPELSGLLILDKPSLARIRTPNLTKVVDQYSDAELERLLRRGIKRDGRGLWVMPVSTHMADDDLAAIIAYLRSVPDAEGAPGEITLGPLARFAIATGKMGSSAHTDVRTKEVAIDRADAMSFGRYLVKSACTECHGSKLEGSEFLKSPSLTVVASYQDEDFEKLMRTGIGVGNRELGKMTEMGRSRFSVFSDAEVDAVLLYLREFVRRGGAQLP